MELESHNYIPGVVMPSQDIKILELNQYQISHRIPYISHAYLESLIKKVDGFKQNLAKSSKKIGEHISCANSMSTVWVFDGLVEIIQFQTKLNCNFDFRVQIL